MFVTVLITEFLKLRRSRVTWATAGGLSLGPLGIALFMWIVREPGRAASLGLLGTKADLAGLEATWPSYFSMLTLIVGVGGMILLSFIVAYVFAREFADGTAKNFLALPVDRSLFVMAKFTVSAVWWALLVVLVSAEACAIGAAMHLPGFSFALLASALRSCGLAAGASFLVAPIVAWVATATRGYLPPVGFAIVMMALGNLFGHTGWSVWFPWSIVPSLIGMVAKPVASLPVGSYVVLAATFITGIVATAAQIRYTDSAE